MSILADASTQFGNSVLTGAPRSHDGSNHAQDKHYHTLRDQARAAQSKHSHFASEASQAYKRGDKAEASELSAKSKKFLAEADRLNGEAATWVFRANNTDSAADEIDLHGLFVKEAVIALDARIQVCIQHSQPLLKAIVGKGLHSETHIAKLRPAVMEHCTQRGIPNEIDHHNPGVVLIHIARGGQGQGGYQGGPPVGGYQQPGGYQQGGGYTPYGNAPQQGYAQTQSNSAPEGINIIRLIFRLFRQCLS